MCRVTMGHLRVTIGHLRVTVGHPRVTIGHLRVTMGHLGVTIGYLKDTVVHIRVTLGHLRVTRLFFSISKPRANTTELHPKVRQTCLPIKSTQKLRNKLVSVHYEQKLSPHWDGLREAECTIHAESNHSYMLPSCLALPARAQSCTCFGGRK